MFGLCRVKARALMPGDRWIFHGTVRSVYRISYDVVRVLYVRRGKVRDLTFDANAKVMVREYAR